MKQRNYLSGLLMLAVLMDGCERKELCYDHNHAANVELNLSYNLDWRSEGVPSKTKVFEWDPAWTVDWDRVMPQEPTGARVITYPHYEGTSSQTYNLAKTGGYMVLSSGTYDMICYNNDTEYLLFQGMEATMQATTRTRTRASYTKAHPDELTVNPPDMLFAAYLKNFNIELQDNLSGEEQRAAIQMQLYPRVFTYIIRYEFESGLDYVAMARGALSGMARSTFLADGHTENTQVTLLYDGEKKDYGVESIVRSFGVPGMMLESDPTKNEDDPYVHPPLTKAGETFYWDQLETTKSITVEEEYEHRLTLELYLINGKEKIYEIDVTDQVNSQPRGGVIVVKGLTVTSEEGQSSTGGAFDATVDDWGENKDVLVPIE